MAFFRSLRAMCTLTRKNTVTKVYAMKQVTKAFGDDGAPCIKCMRLLKAGETARKPAARWLLDARYGLGFTTLNSKPQTPKHGTLNPKALNPQIYESHSCRQDAETLRHLPARNRRALTFLPGRRLYLPCICWVLPPTRNSL